MVTVRLNGQGVVGVQLGGKLAAASLRHASAAGKASTMGGQDSSVQIGRTHS